MILVLDTNVIISALISPAGPPAEIFRLWEQDRFFVASSPPLIAELEKTLAYPKIQKLLAQSRSKVPPLLRRLQSNSVTVEPEISLDLIPDHPTDNRILECAVAAEAQFIITGDKHLLSVKQYRGIIILPPAGYLALTP
jgi:putative PIN family toxin of toxin-antitoxin system